ncbi:MAG: lactate racemase domain-containing protein [Myxococcota bacterium]
MAKTLLLSGFELQQVDLPDDARLYWPPLPLPGLERFGDVAARALDEPVGGEPLVSLLSSSTKVCVVLDDPSLPVPMAFRDCRQEMLEAVLEVCAAKRVRPDRITVLVANGLNRQWRHAELAEWLSPQTLARVGVRCHDAEAGSELLRLGEEPEGPVELHRAVVEADLVVHLSVVSMPLLAGPMGLVGGVAGYRTARFLCAPNLFVDDPSPLVPGSKYHQAHLAVAKHLFARTRVVQLAAVLNTQLWTSALSALLRSDGELTRPLQMWNALPAAVRHRAARLVKASYRPIAALFGSPDEVAPRAREVFLRQHEVEADGPADVVVFGLPDIGPYSVRTAQNPVLAAHLALGLVANLFSEQPLLRPGGVLIFANPLTPVFDRHAHLAHEEFYEKVLRLERDPLAIHERFEPYFAGRPELISSYQRRFAFHGTHPLYLWYQCTPARKRAGRIIVAHGDPRACARLGFMPATDVSDALVKAKDFLGQSQPSVAVLQLPPPFFVRVG